MSESASTLTRTWPAPAKLNLFLHITGRRADGYHLLQTVFQLLDVSDGLRFELNSAGTISRAYTLAGINEQQDIILRAARLLQQTGGIRQGVTIDLDKRLPIGGGLGGGSSTAATTLVALNQLWGCHLSLTELAQLGLQLGADVPVFVLGHTAWGEGVGDVLQPLVLPQTWFVVLAPGVSVSTAEIFSDPQLRRDCPAITIRDFRAGLVPLSNVCEPCVRGHYPQVAAALDALSIFSPARLTGTGACVFAAFATEQLARQAWAELAKEWRGFVAQGVNTSPLHTAMMQSVIAGIE
jgi:4-diphosphocytidyl-2-C-methyl-D-erythritol kinase